jgi:hypothetical protein
MALSLSPSLSLNCSFYLCVCWLSPRLFLDHTHTVFTAGFKRPHLGFYAPKWAFDLYSPASIKLASHRAPPVDMPAPAWSNGGSMGVFNDTRSLLVTRPIETCSECSVHNFSGVFLPDAKHYELRLGYQASVSLVDKQVGRILDALDATGLRDSTIVTFTGGMCATVHRFCCVGIALN